MMSGALLDESSDDDVADLLGGENANDNDELFRGSAKSMLKDAEHLQDEFLDSGSSVYDSDPQHERARFSEDDDESDAEEIYRCKH